MKIKKFNQINEASEDDVDKHIIITVSMKDEFQCTLADIKETTAYWNHLKYIQDKNFNETDEEIERQAVYYGLEEYCYNQGKGGFSYNFVDNAGNKIENLDTYREFIKDTKKYNI